METSSLTAFISCTESDSKCTFCNPCSAQVQTASRRASPSAVRGEATQFRDALKVWFPELEMMTHPNPALLVVESHAASDRITMVSGGVASVRGKSVPPMMLSFFTSMLHSRASLMAEDRVSSGEAECPSNTNLFLAFHSAQKIQGANEPVVIPAG
ncbi:hypothetical protein F2Q68_00038112 [Brassica cretica]|uniref:Uncharacterized protein n=1 Tax=Brassica cretica TaxID=69181 RepID=A0A8S9H9U6_BRACR|nr:hypothetical protein F2Q68_00038112 [Brassica cretica]